MGALLIWLLIGLIAGGIARFLVPGRDPLGLLGTMVLGLVGSLIGGFLANLFFEGRFVVGRANLLGSIIGAIIALLIYRSTRRRRVV